MERIIHYILEFDGDYSIINVPEFSNASIIHMPKDTLLDDDYLDIEHFCYQFEFDPYNTKTFTTFKIQKEGGDDQSARATNYYEQLTREEADGIIRYVLQTALGIEDCTLETDSQDFIEANVIAEDSWTTLKFWVTICLDGGDGGDVTVEVDVSDEEYELLKRCCRDDEDISSAEGLEDLYERVEEAALDESASCDGENDIEINYTNARCMIFMPEEIIEAVEEEQEDEDEE